MQMVANHASAKPCWVLLTAAKLRNQLDPKIHMIMQAGSS